MIQFSSGNLHISSDDFQSTDSGIIYAIKLRYLDSVDCTIAMIAEKLDGDWVSAKIIDSDVTAGISKAGGSAIYAESVIRPAVKAWLAARKLQPVTPASEVAALVGKWQSL